MVDAINAVNGQKIDWYKLTIREIKEYQAEGKADDMPEDVKRWAEEMSAAANVPDNVTYEMSQTQNTGETNNEDASSDSSANAEDQNKPPTMASAIVMGNKSVKATDEVSNLMNEVDNWVDSGKQTDGESKSYYADAISQINALQKERDSLKGDGQQGEFYQKVKEISKVGKAAQTKMDGYTNDLNKLSANTISAGKTSESTISTGSDTVNIGNKVLSTVSGKEDEWMAQKVIRQGSGAVNSGTNGVTKSSGAQLTINDFGQNVVNYKSKINDVSGESAKIDKTSDDKVSKTGTDSKTKQENGDTTSNEEDKYDKSMSDKNINADPVEAEKRREKRGEKTA